MTPEQEESIWRELETPRDPYDPSTAYGTVYIFDPKKWRQWQDIVNDATSRVHETLEHHAYDSVAYFGGGKRYQPGSRHIPSPAPVRDEFWEEYLDCLWHPIVAHIAYQLTMRCHYPSRLAVIHSVE